VAGAGSMVHFHPPEELLLDYASGELGRPWAVLVATHLTLCPDCRDAIAGLDRVGGLFLDEAPPVRMNHGALDSVLARLDEPEPAPRASSAPKRRLADDFGLLPRPLADFLGCGIAEVPWRTILPGVQEYAVPGGVDGARPAMLRIRPGGPVPQHTHRGGEAIVLLAGGFSDGMGSYRRGDVSWADGRHEHRPVADLDEECLCFTVTDAPVRFTGPIGRFLNLFTG